MPFLRIWTKVTVPVGGHFRSAAPSFGEPDCIKKCENVHHIRLRFALTEALLGDHWDLFHVKQIEPVPKMPGSGERLRELGVSAAKGHGIRGGLNSD